MIENIELKFKKCRVFSQCASFGARLYLLMSSWMKHWRPGIGQNHGLKKKIQQNNAGVNKAGGITGIVKYEG